MMFRISNQTRLSRALLVRSFGAAAALTSLLAIPRAHADLHYTQSLTTAQGPSAAMPGMTAGTPPAIHITTDTKGRSLRQETTVQSGSFKATTITLTLCDRGQIVRMDPMLKIYTTTAIDASPFTPFGLPSLPRPGFGGMMPDSGTSDMPAGPGSGITPKGLAPTGNSPFPSLGAPSPTDAVPSEPAAAPGQAGSETVTASPMITGDAPPGEPGGMNGGGATAFPAPTAPQDTGSETKADAVAAPATGSVVLTYACQDLGTETVHDLTTRHYAVTVRRQSSGGAGTGDTTTKMELWLAPMQAGLDCPERTALRRTITNARGSKITYEARGDTDELAQIADQLPVRVRFYDKQGKEQGTLSLQDSDQAALDDHLFTLPANYRQVTAGEFTRAQGQAMFRGLMGNGGPMMPMPSGSGGAYPAPAGPGLPGASGAFPAPTNGGSGPISPSGTYPTPTPPAPTGN